MTFLLALILVAAPPETITAKVVSITDGDTLRILVGKEQVKIRLAGIDAPEKGQAFGTKAKEVLDNMVKGKTVNVETQGLDMYGRTIGTITIDGLNVNLELVKQGMAWRYTKYDKEKIYLQAEKEARQAMRGLWADKDPIAPWEWRKQQKEKRKAKREQSKETT
jgi:endonuclease YncB( thermonuclease family)